MGYGEKTHRNLLGHYSQQMQVQLEPHKLLYMHQSICNRRETSNREKYENGFNEKILPIFSTYEIHPSRYYNIGISNWM